MRILLVTETLALGGAETFALRLARQLRIDGHDAQLLCLNPDFDDPQLVAQFPDVPIHRIPLVGLRTLKRLDRLLRLAKLDLDLQQWLAARWVARHLLGRFDIHHTHLFGADWLFTLLKRRHPDLKIVSTLHGDYVLHDGQAGGTERSRIAGWHWKLAETLHAIDHWVTISPVQHHQFAQLFGVGPERLSNIPNGYIPPARVQPAARSGRGTAFIMVARGIREKGWGYLVAAFLSLNGERSLILVGKGDYLDELRRDHGDDPRITFAGVHHNPVSLIAGADVFVHPSIYRAESMPTVVTEALFAGRPVIATDVGSVATMVSTPSGETAGILVAPEEAALEQQLVDAMQAYLDDPALRASHAALARAAFAKFDMANCAEAYARLYAEVAG